MKRIVIAIVLVYWALMMYLYHYNITIFIYLLNVSMHMCKWTSMYMTRLPKQAPSWFASPVNLSASGDGARTKHRVTTKPCMNENANTTHADTSKGGMCLPPVRTPVETASIYTSIQHAAALSAFRRSLVTCASHCWYNADPTLPSVDPAKNHVVNQNAADDGSVLEPESRQRYGMRPGTAYSIAQLKNMLRMTYPLACIAVNTARQVIAGGASLEMRGKSISSPLLCTAGSLA